MDDLKDALIFTIQNSKAETAINLFSELLILLYSKGYSDGQNYMMDRESSDE